MRGNWFAESGVKGKGVGEGRKAVRVRIRRGKGKGCTAKPLSGDGLQRYSSLSNMTGFYVNVTETCSDGARVYAMVIDERYSTVPST